MKHVFFVVVSCLLPSPFTRADVCQLPNQQHNGENSNISAVSGEGTCYGEFMTPATDFVLDRVAWWGIYINVEDGSSCTPDSYDFSISVLDWSDPPALSYIGGQLGTATWAQTGAHVPAPIPTIPGCNDFDPCTVDYIGAEECLNVSVVGIPCTVDEDCQLSGPSTQPRCEAGLCECPIPLTPPTHPEHVYELQLDEPILLSAGMTYLVRVEASPNQPSLCRWFWESADGGDNSTGRGCHGLGFSGPPTDLAYCLLGGAPVPAASTVGLVVMAAVLVAAGGVICKRRRTVASIT
jgi:hypothetical protein